MAYMLEVRLVLDHASIANFMQNPIMGKNAKKYKVSVSFIYLVGCGWLWLVVVGCVLVPIISYNEI
jgi:hypothetical protein